MLYHSAPYEKLRSTPLEQLRILVTNDDGIFAPGIRILEKVARSLCPDVWVVAPHAEQSAAGHSLTINNPLRIIREDETHFAVTGTPTDAVLLAVKSIFANDRQPDLILSGINRGGNLGEDVTYSGTIAAAMEGTLLDIPSIAFSQCVYDLDDIPWDTAETHTASVIRALTSLSWMPNTLMNVNFPPVPAQDIKGIKAGPHGRRKIGDKLVTNKDPKGRTYFWIGSDRWDKAEVAGSDIDVINQKYISVTPLTMDLTDYKALEAINVGLEKFHAQPTTEPTDDATR